MDSDDVDSERWNNYGIGNLALHFSERYDCLRTAIIEKYLDAKEIYGSLPEGSREKYVLKGRLEALEELIKEM